VARHLASLACLAAVAVLFWGAPAAGHAALHSFVLLDFRAHDVGAELRLPIGELEKAWHRPLVPEGADIVRLEGPALRAYVARYLHVETPEGIPWTVDLGELGYAIDDEVPFVSMQARLAPPPGASPQAFVLSYDVIAHDVVSHIAWVAVRSDFANGVFTGKPTVVGVIRTLRTSLLVDRTGGGDWRGFRGIVQLGMQHIAEGTDHLLFLFTLLLSAPLVAVRRTNGAARWDGYGGFRASAVKLLRIVTAFTLGHSMTLVAASVGWLRLPGRPVEVLIAVSIVVSALHALRPLFPGREARIAGAFGLVHGMAFASALAELHLDPYRLALAIFGFNVGIELMQLFAIALVFPWLLILAKTPAYSFVRWGGGVFAGLAALGWIAERAFRARNPMNAAVNGLGSHALLLVAILAGLALSTTGWSRVVSRRPRPPKSVQA
jgi:hypothetical protein